MGISLIFPTGNSLSSLPRAPHSPEQTLATGRKETCLEIEHSKDVYLAKGALHKKKWELGIYPSLES